ncbi:MAG: hypothetical protein ABSG65_23235 [Bryobacteraceae bacterium]|jgi:hypothetical protein
MPLDSPELLNDNRLYGQPTVDGLPAPKEVMARNLRHSRADGPAQTERDKGWPSILAKVWESGVAAAVAAAVAMSISLVSELAAERTFFQTVRERWAIVAVGAILLFTVGLTIALALRQRRRSPRLTEKVTAAYLRALSGSIINPETNAEFRG